MHVLSDEPPGLVPLQPPQGTQAEGPGRRQLQEAILPAFAAVEAHGQPVRAARPHRQRLRQGHGPHAPTARSHGEWALGAQGARAVPHGAAGAVQKAREPVPPRAQQSLRSLHGRPPRRRQHPVKKQRRHAILVHTAQTVHRKEIPRIIPIAV
uniref:Uncharacterized protein n=1 Tax=Triticum urartu TaxID=4572 RepID=A0A8R7QX95_TRIUA